MAEDGSAKPPRVGVKEAHAERVARAMRENLKKRKEQARAKAQPEPEPKR